MIRVLTAALLATAAYAGPASAQSGGTVDLAYVEWSDAVVATNILKAVLEQEGYTVNLTPLPAAAMWQAVATGEADAMVAAWLPVTHAAYYEELKDQVELIGPNVEGAKIGWAVPAYTDIASVADLKEKGGLVDNQVIGIDPGAGLMQASEKAIEEYDLSSIKLVEGSDATMTAALKDAIDRKEDIVVTTWTPHWMFGRWDLKYLEDPMGAFGGEETVNTVARLDLAEDMPEVHAILKNFKLSLEEEQKVMLENEEGADPATTAKAWVEANADTVSQWTAASQ
ncbi:glycine betaine/proline transport system substrate-binding protein [Aureimonas altamirensis DSM 21988]|jgi:glycine betaine/proline transport system substrate-binding protein|uniref:Glycine betaine ABC transporter substrate-binding protein n=2 Tax=Aureimonas altamirensis TaxID=370622 RepID=A0A0P0YVC6_9HYPH|nr:glycine betaine ABC transporter substrate-binding protein [Aureimonas altamirensis]UHD46098.1 glycine betaine ABC transporter substrate-binding protein [Aureimonas altamirensis]BAT25288.1 glycine betaine ABC transporter substrate-binding protein [Aureimonas altamirensis]SHJ96689.1 glycine betaine/proline transport system substrate-binding protein [Aureimonas altamirensis DSM 21988]